LNYPVFSTEQADIGMVL